MAKISKGDYIRLGRAVSEFNKQIYKNETLQNALYLPETINYKELKQNIQTKEGLNAYIQQMKRINLSGALDLETQEGGVVLSKYTKRELDRARAQQIPQIEKQIAKIEKEVLASYDFKEKPKDGIPKGLKPDKLKGLEKQLQDYKELYSLSGKAFEKRAAQLMVNQTEKKYRQAYIFRKNYMTVMRKNYGNFRDYWIFKKYYADKHKDPVRFYDDLPEDDTYYPDDLYRQSLGGFTEEDFTAIVESLIVQSVDEIYEAEGKRKKNPMTGEELKLQKTAEAQAKKERQEVRDLNKLK